MRSGRVLIISYYWPPCGGIGVHRCLKFAKYLRSFGWEPVVFAPKDAHYQIFDESNFRHIPPGLEVHQVPIKEPFALFKKLTGRSVTDASNPVYVRNKKSSILDNLSIWIRGNFFIPDARALWIRPAVKAISKYIRDEGHIDALFSDGPPHTNTRIAYHISKKFDIPWIADFQDPWTQVDYYKMMKISPLADKIHKKMEQQVFRQAKKITIASPSWAEDIQKIGAQNVSVIYYGYDEEDYNRIENSETEELPELKNRFVITHAGLLGIDRFPKTLIDVLANMSSEDESFRSQLLLFLPGEVDYSIKNYIESVGLAQNVKLPGHLSKDQAIYSMIHSDLLLLPLNQADNARGRLPGKLYEYLRSYTPILALGPVNSDVNTILKQTAAGTCIEYDDAAALRSEIKAIFAAKKKPNEQSIPSFDTISEFDVKNQTEKLANLLNEITDGN